MHLSSQPVHTPLPRILIVLPCSDTDDDAVQGRIRAEQISNIKRYLSAMLLANACNAGILIVALWASPQHQLAIIWATTTLVFTLYHGFKNCRSAHAEAVICLNAARLHERPVMPCFLAVCGRCYLFCSSPMQPPGEQVIIACLCAGVLGGGTFVLASVPAAAIAFTAPIVIASAIAILRSADPKFLVVGVLMISYVAALWPPACLLMPRRSPRELVNRFRLRGEFAATS